MIKDQPIAEVQWIPIEKVFANDYNPNSVATKEMKLLYVIVDGFHRYSIMRRYKDIYASCEGKLPCVVLKGKTMNDLMASTIRHNRARGKHSVQGMSNIVMEMLMNGASDLEICNNLGLEAEELVRLKYITGYAKLYESNEYTKAYMSEKQIEELVKYNESKGEE